MAVLSNLCLNIFEVFVIKDFKKEEGQCAKKKKTKITASNFEKEKSC